MTLLYNDVCFLDHETGEHPERADRLRRIRSRLEELGLRERCRHMPFRPAHRRRLNRVHTPNYIDEIWAYAKSGGGHLDPDTVLSPASYDVALRAAGCVCDAVERLFKGEDDQALCLVRPPGHHALANHAMGFCIFNNVAIAAKMATDELRLDRVLIVDWDVHHGNGTQATFWEDPKVGFLSIHRWPFYPGTGSADESGAGAGLGTTVNLPVPMGISRHDYRAIFTNEVQKLADKMKPQVVFVSAGFDAHRLDPIGSLGLETEDFAILTDVVLDVAAAHAGGKLISVLEGGYNLDALADSVAAHLAALLQRARPTEPS